MIPNLNNLIDPQTFITFYYNELKNELESDDLSISKVGTLGYLIHILGNLQFDIKKYYDGLFKEAFPVSALNDINLQQHAITFGYEYGNSVSAFLNGKIVFDFNNLPSRGLNIRRRTIDISNISFTVSNLPFIVESKYKITIDIDEDLTQHYSAEIINKYGDQQILQISSQFPLVPIDGCKQIESTTSYFNIPTYPFGSYYSIEVDLEDLDNNIESVVVYVTEYNSTTESVFETSKTKTVFSATDKVIFYKIVYRDNFPVLLLELGSGKKGKYIPNSKLRVVINKTKGDLGNIGQLSISQGINGDIEIVDWSKNTLGQFKPAYSLPSLTLDQFLRFEIEEGYGGYNSLSGDNLRKSLVEFIQSRNTLLNELDFKNILSKYFKHVEFLFKKNSFQDNSINIYVSMLDKYLQPLYTLSKHIDYSIFSSNTLIINSKEYIFYPEFEFVNNEFILTDTNSISNNIFISPFLYEYDNFLNLYKGYLEVREQLYNPININNISNNSYSGKNPIFKLGLNFEFLTASVNFVINPIVDIDIPCVYSISIPLLNIYDVLLTDKTFAYPNIFTSSIDVIIKVLKTDLTLTPLFEVKFKNIKLIENTESFLHLKKFTDVVATVHTDKLLDVPLINKNQFLSNEIFYLTKLISHINSSKLTETQLVTDNIQLKFINSFFISSNYVQKITLQQHNFDIYLPLKVEIDLIMDEYYIRLHNINIIDSIDKLKLEVATYLKSKITSHITFYNSQLIDFIHTNNNWIKSINVTLLDNNNTVIDNIETIDQKTFISTNGKEFIKDYCPFLWWFDLNNINIQFEFLGNP